ncbi:hypothetical protein G6L37_07050 [Agrobacterium rubi]|nr:hypothetical protein [Agrobacterium rubi]NTF25123.1 hypothetical protein [Agrobacterium rubi]
MKWLQAADNRLIALMDEIGFQLQVKVGIRRYYLVPLLTLVAICIRYLRTDGWQPDLSDMAGDVIAFMLITSTHLFRIHRKGADTDDMQVNIAVEGIRCDPLFLFVRAFCFCMFIVLVTAHVLTRPWYVPMDFVEFFFLLYPIMIYQQEPPPRHELKMARQ